jgi:predicted ATP-binding protein involved in virulence
LNKYEPYKKLKKHNDLEEIITHLPPPFYSQNIKLYKNGDKTTHILISSLSSGERQFIYNISTIIYHIKNLLSIQQKNRIRYRNVNLILDEVEICFHPEFQRQFISRFLELFDRLNLTRNCSFNIIIITHSPFVLSDIPKKNILYLQDGHQYYDEQLINPFAANINDILYQSFFLNGGFIGENSKNVISSALSALKRKNRNQKISESSIWNQRTLYQLVGIIGEPLIRENLLDLINEAFSNATYEDILKEKETEIEELKHILKQLQNKD